MPTRPRLLIIDDEVDVARTLAMIFQTDGFLVEVAFSGREAIERLARSPKFDAVITDLSRETPASAFDVVRAARQLKPKPVIVISTDYATESNLQMAWNLRVDHIVIKPSPVDELRNAIRRLLSLRKVAGVSGQS